MTTTLAVVGSLNEDLVIHVPRLPGPGETVSGSDVRRGPGGKGANQAVAAARWGAKVKMSGAVGADAAGTGLVAALEDAGIDTRRVAKLPDAATGTALIVVDAAGENTITLAPGANHRFEAVDPGAANAVLAQLEVPVEQVIATFQKARAHRIRTVLNAAPAPAMTDAVRALLRVTDVVIVNESEAAALAALDGSDPDRGLRVLLEAGPGLAVLTLGGAGALAVTADAAWRQPGFPVEVVDTVGAGDAFCAVFVASLAENEGLPLAEAVRTALRVACAAGALTASRPGAQAAPTRAEVEEFLRGR